ncbi:MAG: tRNA dihydrouridine synthase [Thermoleophilia bacterium]
MSDRVVAQRSEHDGAGDDGAVGAYRPTLTDPLRIGSLTIPSRVIMAPMAGITVSAFRRSVRRWGAGLVFTEMISAYGIYYGNRRTSTYLVCDGDEHPIGFQLFGADAEVVARAAIVCVDAGADLIDINMACPARKVVKTGAGAALLGEPQRAAAMVTAVTRAVEGRVPVTVKLRAGLQAGDDAGRQLAPRLVAAGADALCLHPRTAAQLYRGQADHALTRVLAAELPVPIVASGDIDGRAVCLDLLRGGVAAVMLARHALGRPWLFTEVLTGGPPPTTAACLAELRTFAAAVEADLGPRALGFLRQFWPPYWRSGTIGRGLAADLMRAADMATVRSLLALA